jgi:predicted permease
MEITIPQTLQEELIRRVEAIPGVSAAAVTLTLPMTGAAATPVQRADQPPAKLNERPMAILQLVTPGYFLTLGVRLQAGRDFAPTDTATSPLVAIVNQRLAHKFWGTEDPLGRHILIGTNLTPVEVTGVVADVHQEGLADGASEGIYRPRTQFPLDRAMFAVRTLGDPLQLVSAIRREIAAVDRHQAVTAVRTMESVIEASEGRRRSITTLLSIFAASGLLLVIIGIYGVLASSVSQRTREVGIRRALGAQPADVLRLVIGQGLALLAAGVALGIAGAIAATRVMEGLLFQVSPTDPTTFAAVAVILLLVTLAASYIPARRALGIEPAVALKDQ